MKRSGKGHVPGGETLSMKMLRMKMKERRVMYLAQVTARSTPPTIQTRAIRREEEGEEQQEEAMLAWDLKIKGE